MRKHLFIAILFITIGQFAFAQTVAELRSTAFSFMQQNDFGNAIKILEKAKNMEPENIEVIKDLTMAYYFKWDNTSALNTIKPILDNGKADEQAYQLAGRIYLQMQKPKEAEALYITALEKYPQSGPLYNDYGEMLFPAKPKDAIVLFEKGIEKEASYIKNYFNAMRYYNTAKMPLRAAIYAEIFANMERNTVRTLEAKKVLRDSYVVIFSLLNNESKLNNGDNSFLKAITSTFAQTNTSSTTIINAETMTMIRTKFMLEWMKNNSRKFPYKLFSYQNQLIQEGMFDAYNQWLFAPTNTDPAFVNWKSTHETEYNTFNRFMDNQVFKMNRDEYYF